MISVVIPTIRTSAALAWVLMSLDHQTYRNFEIIIVIDQIIDFITLETWKTHVAQYLLSFSSSQILLISHLTHDFSVGKWVSYVRNTGIYHAHGTHCFLLDDDNIFDPLLLQQLYDRGQEIEISDFVFSPTILYRDTGIIQSQWFHDFIRWMSRPEPYHGTDLKAKIRRALTDRWFRKPYENLLPVCMIGANSLYAPRHVFLQYRFDERMTFVYEDLDLTMRISRSGIPIYILADVYIRHMERIKSSTEASFLSARHIYEKSKNRILFVCSNAPRRWQLFFRLIGLPWNTLRLTLHILLRGSDKFECLTGLYKGVRDGLLLWLWWSTPLRRAYLKWYYGYQNLWDEILMLGIIEYIFQNLCCDALTIEVQDVDWTLSWIMKYPSRSCTVVGNTVMIDGLGQISLISKSYLTMAWRQIRYPRETVLWGGGEVITPARGRRGGTQFLISYRLTILRSNYILLGGIGTPTTWFWKCLYPILVGRAQRIIVRDSTSLQVAQVYHHDVTLYQDFAESIIQRIPIIPQDHPPTFLININPYARNTRHLARIATMVADHPHYQLIYIPCDPEDIPYYKQLHDLYPGLILWDRTQHTLTEIVDLFAHSSGGVGARLHFLLFLHRLHRPFSSFVYQEKITKMLGN